MFSRPGNNEAFAAARLSMVKNQIERRGIKDPAVLAALRKVPRHEFVPERYRKYAYEDEPLPIGFNQTISQPYIVALMTELLQVDDNCRVLEIGTGSGYQTAVLAELCDSVYSIELNCELAEQAKLRLQSLGYDNVHIKCADGSRGWPERAPFKAIIVTAAPPEIPFTLLDQLAEGGRLVIPVGTYQQELKLVKKKAGKTIEENIIPVRFVPLRGKTGQ